MNIITRIDTNSELYNNFLKNCCRLKPGEIWNDPPYNNDFLLE